MWDVRCEDGEALSGEYCRDECWYNDWDGGDWDTSWACMGIDPAWRWHSPLACPDECVGYFVLSLHYPQGAFNHGFQRGLYVQQQQLPPLGCKAELGHTCTYWTYFYIYYIRYHYFIISLYYYIVILLNDYVTIFVDYNLNITTLLSYNTTRLIYYYITKLLEY